jgi:hypothetical protein
LAHDAFISYCHDDKAPADAVCHHLEEAGVRCWIAPRDVAAGKRWAEAIVDAITEAELVIVIFTAAANASRHVLDEVSTALDIGRTVIPFRLEDVGPTGELRLHLGGLHWLDALSPPLDAHIDRLIEITKRNLIPVETRKEEKSPVVERTITVTDLKNSRPPRNKSDRSSFLLNIWFWISIGAFFSVAFIGVGISGNYARGNTYPISMEIITSVIIVIVGITLSLLIRMLVIACVSLSRAMTRR